MQEIPRGRVSTYSAIAKAIGKPKAARAVGNALNRNHSSRVPCHRVVRSDGRAGGFARGTREKIRMLRREGVRVVNGKVDAQPFLF
ncbi:cysteine methyltransferase [Candidatus Micrarchaeota archaeon CG10_big_fil_rev_8_21_14_0_10_59_7]|nr:MAG: cysteine methyltransferase [Candidatus Micrarchaeota archaeon CG10_big_fil_rev_8_21_14_0_10_59_7]